MNIMSTPFPTSHSAMDAAACPSWCVEHYDGVGEDEQVQRNHAGEPLSVMATSIYSGAPIELGYWLERRDDHETGEVETFGVLEVGRYQEDLEMTPASLRALASRLNSLADRAELTR